MSKKLDLSTGILLLAILGLALALAFISSNFENLDGFLPFSYVLVVGVLILWLGWHLIRQEGPGKWLLILVVGAALLRLAAGAFWFIELPIYGYPNETQQSGYIMFDAYRRDTAAWELAQSNEPLLSSFQGVSHMDQYGGLLFLSGFVYRYLAADVHYPLQIVVITAAFSAAAGFFVWGLSKQLWGEKAAKIAVWLVALYPEAVLLGSSQMREAFTITLVTAFSYYLVIFWSTRQRKYLLAAFLSVLICLLLSWPMVVMMAFIAMMLAITAYPWATRHKHMPSLLLIAGIIAVVLVVVLFSTLDWWGLVIDYQAYTTVEGSGKLDAIFQRIPEWLHFPYLVAYGFVQPLLPAALVAFSSGWLWHSIAIWRSLGWTLLFGGFLYANLLAFKEKAWKGIIGAFLVVVWGGILVASVRGGGDLWDNPRYRVAFAGLQVMLTAWALWRQQETKDPWLRRVIVTVGMLIAWYLAWYVDRRIINYGWPVTNMVVLTALAFLSSGLYIFWDWFRLKKKRNPSANSEK